MTAERCHILIVEDDPDDVFLLQRALEQLEANIDAGYVGSCAEATDHVARVATDVVLLDLALPDGSGLDIVEELKHSSSHPAIVAMTHHSSVAMAVNAMRNGADNYVEKPVSSQQLNLVINDALLKRQDRQEL